jgi:hypothetical protein
MTTTVPQPRYTWRVRNIVADSELDPSGNVVAGVRINFDVTDPAVSGSVFVANSRKSDQAYVVSAIATEAAVLANIANLSSE